METELQSSDRAAGVLNHWEIFSISCATLTLGQRITWNIINNNIEASDIYSEVNIFYQNGFGYPHAE